MAIPQMPRGRQPLLDPWVGAVSGQVLLPLCAPAVDVYSLAVQVLTAAYALHLDRESYGPLWSLPLQQVVYRQMVYLVVFQSTVMAMPAGYRASRHSR